jgi:hypothetical protein
VEHGRSGYLLPLDTDEHVGKWRWLYRNRERDYLEAYDTAICGLSDALTDRLAQCWEARSEYAALSAGARECARTRFAPAIARERLAALYEGGRRAAGSPRLGSTSWSYGTARRAGRKWPTMPIARSQWNNACGNGVSGYSRRSSSVRRSRGRREMTIPSASRVTSTISGREAMGSEPT